MKSVSRWCLMLALAGLTLLGSKTRVFAQDEDRRGPGERLDRIERRLNELAERQEQFMRGVKGALDQRSPMPGPGPDRFRSPMPGPGPEAMGAPMPPAGRPFPMRPMVAHQIGGLIKLCILGCILCNILLAVWIYTDIRKRGDGPGIFVALALVAGVPSAIIYALVRIGDRKA